MRRSFVARLVCVAAALLLLAPGVGAVATVELGKGVYAFLGSTGEAGPENSGEVGNGGFVVGREGIVVINTGSSYRHGREIIEAAEEIGGKRVVLAIITQPLQEFVMGSAAFTERGIPLLAHEATARLIGERCANCLSNLKRLLGEEAMSGTRVIIPGRTVAGSEELDAGGRRLRLVHLGWASTPGDLAVLDSESGVLFAGALVSIGRIPEARDANVGGWLNALAVLRQLPVRTLVPGYGPPGSTADVEPMARYLRKVEETVRGMRQAGEGLLETVRGAHLPEFDEWDLYPLAHRRNVQQIFLRLEAEELAR